MLGIHIAGIGGRSHASAILAYFPSLAPFLNLPWWGTVGSGPAPSSRSLCSQRLIKPRSLEVRPAGISRPATPASRTQVENKKIDKNNDLCGRLTQTVFSWGFGGQSVIRLRTDCRQTPLAHLREPTLKMVFRILNEFSPSMQARAPTPSRMQSPTISPKSSPMNRWHNKLATQPKRVRCKRTATDHPLDTGRRRRAARPQGDRQPNPHNAESCSQPCLPHRSGVIGYGLAQGQTIQARRRGRGALSHCR